VESENPQNSPTGRRALSSKILILTVTHGASHTRAAHALRQALTAAQPDLAVEVQDGLSKCAKWFRSYYNSYLIPLKIWPSLWGWIEGVQHSTASTGPGWLYARGGRPLFRFIEKCDPDIIVATEVGMCELAALHKRRSGGRFRLVAAPTGLDADRAWVQPEVDLYLAAPGDATEQLGAAGAAVEKIVSCGTPIDPAFEALPGREAIRVELQLDPAIPVLLVLFGGAGFGKPRRIVPELEKIEQPLQAVFIAGKNSKMEEKLKGLCRGRARWRVLGWVENMHEWMTAADLLVSKPGASTVVEALACGLPFVALDPLPGNERRACTWIEKERVGRWAQKAHELAPAIERLLTFPEERQQMRLNALTFGRPRAAREAAAAILKLPPSQV
jgi:processive 1,2-diacylglycerol beta-glucosyltransferase